MFKQDWKPVVFTKHDKKMNTFDAKNKNVPQISFDAKKKINLENETLELSHQKVTHDLKTSIMKARQSRNITQKDLATTLQISTKIVNEYESGKIVPDNLMISKFEKALGAKLPRIKKK